MVVAEAEVGAHLTPAGLAGQCEAKVEEPQEGDSDGEDKESSRSRDAGGQFVAGLSTQTTFVHP